jgi:hypothetical protein
MVNGYAFGDDEDSKKLRKKGFKGSSVMFPVDEDEKGVFIGSIYFDDPKEAVEYQKGVSTSGRPKDTGTPSTKRKGDNSKEKIDDKLLKKKKDEVEDFFPEDDGIFF